MNVQLVGSLTVQGLDQIAGFLQPGVGAAPCCLDSLGAEWKMHDAGPMVTHDVVPVCVANALVFAVVHVVRGAAISRKRLGRYFSGIGCQAGIVAKLQELSAAGFTAALAGATWPACWLAGARDGVWQLGVVPIRLRVALMAFGSRLGGRNYGSTIVL